MQQSVLDRGIINIGSMYRFHKVFKKMEKREECNIVFLGGSITQGCNAAVNELCYAYRVYDWFVRMFPATKINFINAGIGATTSELGVARVSEDVLKYNPDIVFVEFSVNDSNNEKFMETYESLLRKILLSLSEPAVFTFNNVQYDDGVNAQEVHNKIGKFYDLPIVSMRDSIYEEILLGNITSEDISTDNLHPNSKGHGLLYEAIVNLLQVICAQYFNGEVDEEVYVVPDKTITPVRFFSSERIRNEVVKQIDFESNNVTVDEREQYEVKDCFKKGIIFNGKDSYVSADLIFKGLSVQFCKHPGTESPKCSIYVDGEQRGVLDGNFDETWGDCLYLQNIIEFDTRKIHSVRIEVEEYPENCENGFYFVSFITY